MEKEETDETELIVAVGLTGGRKSKHILKWALEKFLPESNVRFRIIHVYPKITIVPTPIGWVPITQAREDVKISYKYELESKKKKALIPYQQASEAQQIKSDIVLVESNDIAEALCLEVIRLSIRHLVVGLSSTSIFSRKHLSLTKMLRDNNVSAAMSEKAPHFCSVYIIANGKLQNLRPSESEPTVISIHNTRSSSSTYTDSSSDSSSLTLGHQWQSKTLSPQNPGSGSMSSTKPTKPGGPEPQSNNQMEPVKTRERIDAALNGMSFGNHSNGSQSSCSGDSGSWVSDRIYNRDSSVGTPPPRSFTSTPLGGSYVGTPPSRSYVGTSTPLGGSYVGTPPSGSYVGTPHAVSSAGRYYAESMGGTSCGVSFTDITPPGSFVATPPAGLSPTSTFVGTLPQQLSASSQGQSSQGQNNIYELEKIRMQLRHTEKMRQLARSNNIDEKVLFPINQLNTLSKERLEAALKMKEEKDKETTSTEKNKPKDAPNKAQSSENALRNKPRYREETGTAQKADDYANKPKQLIFSPVTQCQKFSWNEIVDATSSLSEIFKIGAGAFGRVYKCKLHHTTVAVKVLHSKDTVTNKQFLQELEILSTIRHPHILLLLGAVPEESCLIYEYMENGSLEDRLFRKDNCSPLPWYERVRICWEVAGALAFLHSTKPRPIIHRDLKPANILLDQHLVSKIGDAGLGTTITMEPNAMSRKTMYKETSPVGTLCYIDPEYQRTGRVSTKSDIYALGVVILQLLTTKSAVGIAYLVEDALEENTLMEILDQEAGKWPEDVALELASLGLLCSELRGRDRPDLIDIVLPALEKLKEAAADARKEVVNAPTALPHHFICPISKDIMDDPYVAVDGYTYDRAALEKWLAENNTSPTTNLLLPHKFIMPNNTMLEAITEWKSKQPLK